MSLRKTLVSQFEHPRGWLGRIVGRILAGRGSNIARNRQTVELINPVNGERVLEVGCGPGVALQLCLTRKGVKAVGVDHSTLMIKQAAKRNAKAVKAGRLRLIEGTIVDVPPSLGLFDKVFSINVIQFVDRAAFVERAWSLLNPGGAFVTVYQPRHVKATREDALKLAREMSALLATKGFSDVRQVEFDLNPVPAVCVLGRRN